MFKEFALVTALGLPLALTTAPATAQDATPPAATATSSPIEVKVEVKEYAVAPAQTTFVAGQPYHFVITNAGSETHEFVIEPAGAVDAPLETEVNGEDQEAEAEEIAPGQSKELTWTFAQPGDYQVACHVPGHFEHGMVTPIDVVPAGTETVQVQVGDFFVKPATTDLKAGTPYLFAVTNTGQATHEFVIEAGDAVDEPLAFGTINGKLEAEVEEIAPGETKQILWQFAEPGAYQLACHVPGHFEAGMKAPIQVSA